MHAALVVMAAGLASRYGSVKQIERVGPGGEILMEYAIYDALRAGFDRVVVIVRRDMVSDMEEVVGERVARATGIPLRYAVQETAGGWRGVPLPAGRKKPLGTVHALLSAEEWLDRPFAVVNADDFYGRGTIAAVGAALPGLAEGEAAMAAYRLENTVSPFGAVTRGVCTGEGGLLRSVTETYDVRPWPDGTIRSGGADGAILSPTAPVSMNIWGFRPEILARFGAYFEAFLRELPPGDDKSECLLPMAVDTLLAAGEARCRMLDTDDHWFGLTYAGDKPGVVDELRRLHAAGVYPPALWS